MNECNCYELDSLVAFLYGERRWLKKIAGVDKSDQEMLKDLEYGIATSDPLATRYLLDYADNNSEIDF